MARKKTMTDEAPTRIALPGHFRIALEGLMLREQVLQAEIQGPLRKLRADQDVTHAAIEAALELPDGAIGTTHRINGQFWVVEPMPVEPAAIDQPEAATAEVEPMPQEPDANAA